MQISYSEELCVFYSQDRKEIYIWSEWKYFGAPWHWSMLAKGWKFVTILNRILMREKSAEQTHKRTHGRQARAPVAKLGVTMLTHTHLTRNK